MFGVAKRRAMEEIRNSTLERLMTDIRSDYVLGKIDRETREKRMLMLQSDYMNTIEFENGKSVRQMVMWVLIAAVGLVFVIATTVSLVLAFKRT
jgi:hypothetical protein